MGTLDRLDARAASHVPGWGPGAKNSIAAHAGHLLFAFDLFNRAMRGEDAYSTAKWDESWRMQTVDDAAWSNPRARLREQIGAMLEGIRTHHADLAKENVILTGSIASVAHGGVPTSAPSGNWRR